VSKVDTSSEHETSFLWEIFEVLANFVCGGQKIARV
jgi:hypothetical protein